MIENILANLKIERLNPMQEASINAWKEGKDLILLSPTGSGKTYALPISACSTDRKSSLLFQRSRICSSVPCIVLYKVMYRHSHLEPESAKIKKIILTPCNLAKMW